MDGRVQFATTADGVSIAFAIAGAGMPLVHMSPLPLRHLELERRMPEDGRWLDRVGRGRMLVRYDPRGLGLSQREVGALSLDALITDLEAVVERVPAERVALFAPVNTAGIAVAYALRHPERVSHLVLWCASPRGADGVPPQIDVLLDLARKDWALVTETLARVLRGWSAGEAAEQMAVLVRESVTPEVAAAMVAVGRATDVTPLLPRLQVPTLVLHRREVSWIPLDRARELASSIPGARLVILEGASISPAFGDVEAGARAIDDFLGDVPAATGETTPAVGRDEAVFRRDGEYWTLAFAGRLARVRDVKGMHHIAYLVRHPHERVPAATLVADPGLPGAARPGGAPPGAVAIADLGDAGAILDAKAKAAYRRRVADLRAEIDEAERFNDSGRAARARAEAEAVMAQLAAAVGLGGRDRKLGSTSERARLTVTKRIKDALARIREHHPELARHLSTTIKTGITCAYEPDPDPPISWST